MVEVLVAGSGPAGWAVANACAQAGLATVLIAPNPHEPWPATYGLWADETALLPPGSRWAEAPATAFALAEHRLDRSYAVLDNSSIRNGLSHPDIMVIPDRIAGSSGHTATLASGRVLSAALMIDATGARPGGGAAQTAYGVILAGAPAQATVMDWRPAPGFDSSTFLYTVPLPGDRVLVEETSLARRPGLGTAELRARLAARGITGAGAVERVRIPVGRPVPRRRPGMVPFGAAGGLVHPATGYSVADAFRLAPRLAEAIAATLRDRPDRAAWQVLWPPAARAVHLLRRRGLALLLGLPPHQVPEFFELFFGLPAPLRRAYLSGREDLRGTAAAMAGIFWSASRTMRTTIARSTLFSHQLGPMA